MTIKTDIVTITAEKAKELLARNNGNRRVSAANLARVKAALVRGEWKLNGEAIKIAIDSSILDGQHRLIACVETGIAFRTLVITGLPNDTQETMDSGKARTAADALTLRGYKNATRLSAIAMAIIKSEQYSLKVATMTGGTYPVTTQQIIARVEAESSLEDLTSYVRHFGRIGLHGRTAGLLFYRFSEIDREDAQDFFDRLLSGNDLPERHPILTLRTQLGRLKDDQGTKSQAYAAAIVIKAWNKYRAGEPATVLRFTPGGANPEKFPEPR